MHEFTFYGDLLGIASAYRLGVNVAHDKLNTFYNVVFNRLGPLCGGAATDLHVHMFSDSIVAWGPDARMILPHLQRVYLSLIERNLLLRGAIVHQRLEREPRVEVDGFGKFMPANDTLARAVGLEKTVKGARCLIEPMLANQLLADQPEWLTAEGYIDAPYSNVARDDVLRRICPTPAGTAHELLYFWAPNDAVYDQKQLDTRLKQMAEFHDPFVTEHLRETGKLLRRSRVREKQTTSAA